MLEVNQLTKSFGNRIAVDHLEFKIASGEVFTWLLSLMRMQYSMKRLADNDMLTSQSFLDGLLIITSSSVIISLPSIFSLSHLRWMILPIFLNLTISPSVRTTLLKSL